MGDASLNAMAAPEFLRKVLWAVDAFMVPGSLWTQTLRSLKALAEKNPGVLIQPIYVLSPPQLNLSVEFGSPILHPYEPAAQKALEQLFLEVKIKQLARPKILTLNLNSTLQVVKALSSLALELDADLLVVSTHGRAGLKRLLLGSFAETLLYHSKVPVWVVSERMKRALDFKHLLFPTDFGVTARMAFRYAVGLANSWGARLTLFHAIPHPIEPVLQSGVYLLGGGWIPIQAYFNREVERRTRHAERWAAWSRQQGVETEVVVDPEGMGLSERIITLASKRRSSVIIMEAESGPVTAALIGSITRNVLRGADCPVLVLRAGRLEHSERSRLPRAA